MKMLLILMFSLLLLAGGSAALAQTSTPAPTPDPLDNHDLYSGLSTAGDSLNGLPDNLSSPNGPSLLPSADGHEIFAYAKWLLSSSAEDLFGPFAPIFVHLSIVVTLTATLGSIYVIVWVAAYAIRFIIFIIKLILQVAGVIADVAGAIASAGGGVLGALLGFLGL